MHLAIAILHSEYISLHRRQHIINHHASAATTDGEMHKSLDDKHVSSRLPMTAFFSFSQFITVANRIVSNLLRPPDNHPATLYCGDSKVYLED